MKRIAEISWWAAVANAAVIACALIILSGAVAQAGRSFDGQTSAKANAGVRVVANASVPRTHGPATKHIIDFASDEAVGTIIISNMDRRIETCEKKN